MTNDGKYDIFDVKPYLDYEVFSPLKQPDLFMQITNGGYFIEWSCGADLSADTVEAKMRIVEDTKPTKK